jgi:vacuolar-type H+-ATPase subunit I/STV1
MNSLTDATRKPTLLLTVLMGGVIFTSCASAPNLPEAALNNQTTASQPAALPLAGDVATSQKAETAQIPRSRPQLIKKAAISLIVDSVDKSLNAVSQIINKQQGDLISLQEQQPTKTNARHTASIQLRVPQNLLQPTLDELAKLGTVQSRNISAEDVGDQLVDIQARLTNLRKTEVNLQKIMDRAGSVRDVLSVAQELSQVRQSIEQIAAQLKNLQNQVTYSTITLKLEAAVSSSGTQRALSSQLQESWNKSTNSFGDFTVGLLKLGIWLMVYSPYFLALAAVGYGFNRWRRGHSPRLRRTPDANSD